MSRAVQCGAKALARGNRKGVYEKGTKEGALLCLSFPEKTGDGIRALVRSQTTGGNPDTEHTTRNRKDRSRLNSISQMNISWMPSTRSLAYTHAQQQHRSGAVATDTGDHPPVHLCQKRGNADNDPPGSSRRHPVRMFPSPRVIFALNGDRLINYRAMHYLW